MQRVSVKFYRSFGRHPLTVSETKDWALSTFNKNRRQIVKAASEWPNYSTKQWLESEEEVVTVYTSYYNGCPNNVAFVYDVYETD